MSGGLRRVCVYCGSSLGADPAYRAAAEELAELLVGQRIGIVYGGAGRGLMGVLADAALAAGGEVVGVIPQALVDKEIAHPEVGDLRIVGSMHERKALMAELSDAFVALPGGLGTLEELFEILTWTQLGLHRKPAGALNVRGYFDRLAAFLDHAVGEGFLRPENRASLIVGARARTLLEDLAAWQAPQVEKWIDPRTA